MADPGIIEAPSQTAGRRAASAGGTAAAGRVSGGAPAAAARAAPAHRDRAGWRLAACRGTSRRVVGRRRAGALALGDWYTFIQQIA